MTTAKSRETNLIDPERHPGDVSGSIAGDEPRPTFAGRMFEWFWRRRAMDVVRGSAAAAPPRIQELHRRAQLAAELGARAQDPVGPLANGAGDAIACDLYRQSIYWSLRAMRSSASKRDAHMASGVELQSVWNDADPALLVLALAGVENVAVAKRALLELSFVDLAELPEAEAARLARRLQHMASALLESIGSVERVLDDLLWQRVARVGAVVLFVAAGLIANSLINERREMQREQLEIQQDLAAGKPWKQSSMYQPACVSPAQSCAESPDFFFTTDEEENPTLEFDLGEPKRFSSVRIINRTDCCQERAVPLAIEVSNDAETWKEVARRIETFSMWKADFPEVSARYVRFRALRKTYLHFNQVRILP